MTAMGVDISDLRRSLLCPLSVSAVLKVCVQPGLKLSPDSLEGDKSIMVHCVNQIR